MVEDQKKQEENPYWGIKQSKSLAFNPVKLVSWNPSKFKNQ